MVTEQVFIESLVLVSVWVQSKSLQNLAFFKQFIQGKIICQNLGEVALERFRKIF